MYARYQSATPMGAAPASGAATGAQLRAMQTPQLRLLTYFVAGTLGLVTLDTFERRGATSTWAQAQRPAAPNQASATHAALTPATQLDRIRTVLKASVADTAAIFGVSRQALYNWRGGEAISAANLAKLDDLSAAVTLLAEAGLDQVPHLARRKLGGGMTLLETAREGRSVRETATALIQMLERENAQRERLQRRLAGRQPVRVDANDAGVPAMNERA